MPTSADYDLAGDIIVTALRDRLMENHPSTNSGCSGGAYHLFDGATHFAPPEDPQWLQGLKDALARFTGDDDGDSVSNFFDKLHGQDDNVPKVEGPDGSHLAEIAPEIYAYFNSAGDKFWPYYQMKSAEFTSGSNDVSLNISANDGGVSFNGNDSMKYILEVIENPFG